MLREHIEALPLLLQEGLCLLLTTTEHPCSEAMRRQQDQQKNNSAGSRHFILVALVSSQWKCGKTEEGEAFRFVRIWMDPSEKGRK